MSLPDYPTTVVGSWPRSKTLLKALRDKRAGRLTDERFQQVADEAVLACLRYQHDAGVDIVSDGEQRRDNFVSFVAEKLENVNMLRVSELLDYIEDKASFEEILGTLDVPAYSLTNPAAVGPIRRKKPLALDEYLFVKQHTDRPVKVALPGPYLLTRSMWVEGLSKSTYPTKEDLATDVVRVLREELNDLIEAGVAFVQLDEPVLTELVFTQKNANRTFMCGALTAKKDAQEELRFATDLINQVTSGFRGRGTRIGVHICRGNWSTNESVLLKGPYFPLIPYLAEMHVDQLILEYATPRAGELEALREVGEKEIGLGVVNPRTDRIEHPDEIVAKVRQLNRLRPDMTVFLNPDCGFGTFAQRPMNTPERAFAKLQMMVEAARQLRET
ncbi:5-methyltetrahydropteroyltriglutamate--homocysteine methyltransferase [Caldalkalibacillus uzonensis]|uniref:5-methyltetrahydropteroyltriglutamate--homocysteine methyltransferase n=1 Tax=Caldalkalibacillus uzonensis TaxID=353224 RepID=A0ABU0CVB8_9BACI|nr:cobalamin-independent methionine synthase II family protein [Caldalkalibacillus uzonensis]MDQ0339841.1 5-methyltetrahydropteroyltriglutamate--homocysteine methyltransferase [Caldalkalibacillus uzonensis]